VGLAPLGDLHQGGVVVPTPSPRLTHLALLWLRASSPWPERILAATVLVATLAGAHLAREGTPIARVATVAIVLAIAIGSVIAAWWTRWSDRDTARLAKKLGALEHPSLGDRAARAMHLVSSTDAAGDPLDGRTHPRGSLSGPHVRVLAPKARPPRISRA